MGKKGRVLPFARPTPREGAEHAVGAASAAGPVSLNPVVTSPANDGSVRPPATPLPRRVPGESRPMPGNQRRGGAMPGSARRVPAPAGPRPVPAAWAAQPDPDRVIEAAEPAPGPGSPVRRPTGRLEQPAPADERPDGPRQPDVQAERQAAGSAAPAPADERPDGPRQPAQAERQAGGPAGPGPGTEAGRRPTSSAGTGPGAEAGRRATGSAGTGPGTEAGRRAGGLADPGPGTEVERRAGGSAVAAPAPEAAPSWAKVAGTTLQLYLARRPTRWRVIAALVVALVVFAGGALTVALLRSPGSAPAAAKNGRSATAPAGLAPVQAAAAARQQAAKWVAAQVSHDVVVSCDPAMCAALQTQGFPAGNLMTLGPGTSDPLGSSVIVATDAVRSQFGSRLTSVYAPTVLASFGSGSGLIDVRAYAPGGAAVYLAALQADQRTRQNLGRALLHNFRVAAVPLARAQLAAGLVDTRLLATLATLAGQGPVSVAGFSDSGPGASPGVPMRAMALASPPGAKSGYLTSLLALLHAQQPPYLASSLSLARVDGHQVVQVEFAAPSPLGLMSG